MALTQLQTYQDAARVLGQRKPASLTEATELTNTLNDIYARGRGAITACLEEGLWNFAMRTIELNYDSSVTSSFGYQYAFSKPTDWVRTAGMGSDPYLSSRLRDEQCKDEQGYWWADITPLYVRYVSNDNSYGSNLALWPESFANFFAHYLAFKAMPTVVKAENQKALIGEAYKKARLEALNKDAMNEGSPSYPEGNWTKARRGFRARWDRGSRSQLIG